MRAIKSCFWYATYCVPVYMHTAQARAWFSGKMTAFQAVVGSSILPARTYENKSQEKIKSATRVKRADILYL